MSKIFLSYRWDDSSAATRLIYDALKGKFSEQAIFWDLHDIEPGINFVDRINSALDQSAIVLVIIGPKWLDMTDNEGKRRLEQLADPVRVEVATALQKGLPILPVSVDGAAFPSAARLPKSIKKLAEQNGIAVRNGHDFDNDMSRVISMVTDRMASQSTKVGPTPPEVLPPKLAALGFRYIYVDSVDAIVPLTIDIAAGPFQMGSRAADVENEPHTVSTRPFAIGKFPVTVAEYACFVRAGHATPLDNEVLWQDQLGRLDHPVVNVTWFQAREYALWLAKLTKQQWRLPTEAEWEKAARWDPSTRTCREYPWGEKFDSTRCNTRMAARIETNAIDIYGARGASPRGVVDMAGNVWEWTTSLWRPYPYVQSDGRERDDVSLDPRVRRGGSWDSVPLNCRTAKRAWSSPDVWHGTVGFRLALGALA